MIPIRPATAADHPALRALLAASSLPVEDIAVDTIDFLVAELDGALLGVVAVQACGDIGLLRSLTVDANGRGRGLGQALVERAEAHARARGLLRLVLLRLVLLTETAAAFFSRRGYVPAERGDMPAQIQSTAQFRSLCPATASCWSKHLGPP
ncbi:arsenic resistance N-acetyltransferase ArsN2 [Lysobacter yananisis]|uniref:Arsenic resistance N-acetyltransferase ArsN2 n=1 Tax=Lysobacter yananisis TaxID=1003114 RepID=A0ABY9PAX4_9GAMM|nr:arsenic resistance N-acetyltransferase ArsN2 [Lysobacter yananisis]WMT04114.1 arsenic resistance N-acetyltransferase ArsN2 [Lysobacter yananisis]